MTINRTWTNPEPAPAGLPALAVNCHKRHGLWNGTCDMARDSLGRFVNPHKLVTLSHGGFTPETADTETRQVGGSWVAICALAESMCVAGYEGLPYNIQVVDENGDDLTFDVPAFART